MLVEICDAGTYNFNNTCLPCVIGYISESDEDNCTECPPGQTTLEQGEHTCIGKIEPILVLRIYSM